MQTSYTNADFQFYPTPDDLVQDLHSLIKWSRVKRVLEPNAGKGDLIKPLKDNRRHLSIDVIEIDPILRASLIQQNFNVVGTDFLSFSGDTQYDLIIMNPPFKDADAHIVKAINMLYDGQLIAICNAETINNPYSKERTLLLNLIKKYNGTIEFRQNSFSNSERKTDVEIAIINVFKKGDMITDFFKLDDWDLTKDYDSVYVNEESLNTQVAIRQSKITELVSLYRHAIDTSKESIISIAKANYHRNLLRLSTESRDCYLPEVNVKEEINKNIDEIRTMAWCNILTLSDFQKIMSDKVRTEFDKKLDIISKLEFTENNIREFLKQLMLSQNEIQQDTLLEVFDLFTRYHKDNVIHYEGWKSNSKFKIGDTEEKAGQSYFLKRRVVLPYITRPSYSGGLELNCYATENKLNDIDRAMMLLEGLYETPKGENIVSSIKKLNCPVNTKIESRYFDIRLFKKGTAHFYFKDVALLERLNIKVGQIRKWLPDSDIDTNLLLLARG